MEARIKKLCSQLLRTKEPEEAEVIGEQLRSAIHDHIENLRDDVIALPMLEAVLQS